MTLKVSVVSPEREVWSGEASMVSARTLEGEIGVLTGHEPMLAILADGEVRVQASGGGQAVTARVDGGFLSVDHDTVLVVAERVSTGGEPDGSDGGADQRGTDR